MIPRIGVGSAVTVVVGVSDGGSVAAVRVGLAVRETVLIGAPSAVVASAEFRDGVTDGIAEGVEVDWTTATD
jgi:hypothetical protein